MKKLLVAGWTLAQCVAAVAQGTVLFSNQDPASGTDFAFYLADGTTKLSGSQFMAELLVGATPSLSLPAVAQVGFLTGANAGYFNGGVLSVPGLAPGSAAYVQIHVWNTATGASFNQAFASGLPNAFVQTPTLAITLGGNGTTPATLTTFNVDGPFALNTSIPEPSPVALTGLALAGILLTRAWRNCAFGSPKGREPHGSANEDQA